MGEWTTEEVRRELTFGAGMTAAAEFDAWLDAHDAEVARAAAEQALRAAADNFEAEAMQKMLGTSEPWELDHADYATEVTQAYLRDLADDLTSEPPEPFDLDTKLAEAGMPPFPTIHKEDSNG